MEGVYNFSPPPPSVEGLDLNSSDRDCARLGSGEAPPSRGGLFFRYLSLPLASLLTALRAGPQFSWGVTSGGPPGGRSLSKDGTRADSAKDFCRLVGGVYYAGNLISD